MDPPKNDLIELELKDCKMTSVVVYTDRAEVTRSVNFDCKNEGSLSVVIKGLTDKASTDSIRVKVPAKGSNPCTIEEVSFDINRRPAEAKDDSGKEGELRRNLKDARARLEALHSEQSRAEQQDRFVQDYMKSMLQSTRPNSKDDTTPPPVGADLDVVQKLLEFHAAQGKQTDSAVQELREKIQVEEAEIEALRSNLDEVQAKQHRASRTVASRDITIALNLPGPAGSVELELTYLVNGASWSPTYDIRAEVGGDEESEEHSSMHVTYFGVVRQSTGEDWEDVALSLSTASPAMAGTPPIPPTKIARFKQHEIFQQSLNARRSSRNTSNMLMSRAAMPQQAMAAPPQFRARNLSIDAAEAGMDSDSEEEDEPSVPMPAPTSSVKQSGGGASTFAIERRCTIASDNKEHKVTVTMVDLLPNFRYFCTPSLEERAYLQCRSANNSAYPFLSSDRVAIFVDGNFITTTSIKHTSPGESLCVFLGVDPSIKIQHRLIKQTEKTGEEKLFRTKQMSRRFCDYRTIVHNTKAGRSIDITVVQVLPRSDNEKITVDLIAPPKAQLQESKGSSGENQLRPGGVMQNKLTNNVVFDRQVPPSKKEEIEFTYAIEWPHDAETGKIEVV